MGYPNRYTETPHITDDSFIRLTMPAGQQLVGTDADSDECLFGDVVPGAECWPDV